MQIPSCFYCGKDADKIEEYIDAARENEMTVEEFIRFEEGTFNPYSNRFCCTSCYIEIGMPTNPEGWKAP